MQITSVTMLFIHASNRFVYAHTIYPTIINSLSVNGVCVCARLNAFNSIFVATKVEKNRDREKREKQTKIRTNSLFIRNGMKWRSFQALNVNRLIMYATISLTFFPPSECRAKIQKTQSQYGKSNAWLMTIGICSYVGRNRCDKSCHGKC